jgi:hypothetical protein
VGKPQGKSLIAVVALTITLTAGTARVAISVAGSQLLTGKPTVCANLG